MAAVLEFFLNIAVFVVVTLLMAALLPLLKLCLSYTMTFSLLLSSFSMMNFSSAIRMDLLDSVTLAKPLAMDEDCERVRVDAVLVVVVGNLVVVAPVGGLFALDYY